MTCLHALLVRQSWYQCRTNDGRAIIKGPVHMGADEDDMLYKQLRDGIVLANCCSINFMLCMQ